MKEAALLPVCPSCHSEIVQASFNPTRNQYHSHTHNILVHIYIYPYIYIYNYIYILYLSLSSSSAFYSSEATQLQSFNHSKAKTSSRFSPPARRPL
jgi:hypothetical protein